MRLELQLWFMSVFARWFISVRSISFTIRRIGLQTWNMPAKTDIRPTASIISRLTEKSFMPGTPHPDISIKSSSLCMAILITLKSFTIR